MLGIDDDDDDAAAAAAANDDDNGDVELTRCPACGSLNVFDQFVIEMVAKRMKLITNKWETVQ